MNNKVTDADMGLDDIIKSVTVLKSKNVEVGLFSEDRSADREYNMAELGYIQEKGNDDIVARPFMDRTAIDFESEIAEEMEYVGGMVSTGKMTPIKAFDKIGSKYTQLTKVTISRFSDPKNKESTIKRKGGIDDPLVDTGKMQESVKYKIFTKRGKSE